MTKKISSNQVCLKFSIVQQAKYYILYRFYLISSGSNHVLKFWELELFVSFIIRTALAAYYFLVNYPDQ